MSRSRRWQIESHHAPPAPGLHTDERRCVSFPHIAGGARFPSTELSEQSSYCGCYAGEAIFNCASEKAPFLARPINLGGGVLNSVRRLASKVLDHARDVTLQLATIFAKRREIGIHIRLCTHDIESPVVARTLAAMRGTMAEPFRLGKIRKILMLVFLLRHPGLVGQFRPKPGRRRRMA